MLLRRVPAMFAPRDGEPFGTRGRYWAWNWGYLGRAAGALHAATSDPSLLEVLRLAHHYLRKYRDDRLGLVDEARGRAMRAWGKTGCAPKNARGPAVPRGCAPARSNVPG